MGSLAPAFRGNRRARAPPLDFQGTRISICVFSRAFTKVFVKVIILNQCHCVSLFVEKRIQFISVSEEFSYVETMTTSICYIMELSGPWNFYSCDNLFFALLFGRSQLMQNIKLKVQQIKDLSRYRSNEKLEYN